MGFFKKVGKALKSSVKNMFRGGLMWDQVNKHVVKPVTNKVQDMLGLGALKDMAAGQEETLRRQGEANKLDAANEIGNVTQFDDTADPSFVTSGKRRPKRSAGGFSQSVGLNF